MSSCCSCLWSRKNVRPELTTIQHQHQVKLGIFFSFLQQTGQLLMHYKYRINHEQPNYDEYSLIQCTITCIRELLRCDQLLVVCFDIRVGIIYLFQFNSVTKYPFLRWLQIFLLSPIRHLLDLTMQIIWRMSDKKTKQLPMRAPKLTPVFSARSVWLLSFIFCVVLIVFILLLLPIVACVSWIIHSWLTLWFYLTCI